MQKETVNKIILTIGATLLGTILTTSISLFESKIKNILGIEPKILYQKNEFYNETQDLWFYKITIYNESTESGDLLVKVKGTLIDSKITIEKIKEKPIIEEDSSYVRLKLIIYPDEDFDIVFQSSDQLEYSDFDIGSTFFQIESVYPFPIEEKFGSFGSNYNLFFLFVSIFYFVGLLLYFSFKNIQNKDKK